MTITIYTKCIKCGKTIAITKQIEGEDGFKYITENKDCRFIDKWGYERNFCKECMK